MAPQKLIVIAGPTGSGKSELAIAIASAIGGEVVNYDSVQIYRGFDIGSAKPDAAMRAAVPHHLFDIVDAGEEFNASDYGRLARTTCAEIDSRGKRVVLAGGTFFYLDALLRGLPEMPGRDEVLRRRLRAIGTRPGGPQRLHRWLSKIDPRSGRKIAVADRHRVERALEVWLISGRPISSWERPETEEVPSLKIGLAVARSVLVERIDRRVAAMFDSGLVDETRQLLARFPASARPFGTIGYREAAAVVRGEMNEQQAVEETRRRTRAYAKRQLTWLRSDRNMHWIEAADARQTFAAAMRLIEVES